MNPASKRNLKSKTVLKTVTLKEMLSSKDSNNRNSANTSNTSENPNESFIDVFRLNAVKEKKFQFQSCQNKESKSKTDDTFVELFSDFKNKIETSKEDSAPKSDDSFDELFSDFSVKAKTSTDVRKVTVNHEEKDFTEILHDNLSPRCPICFRKNSFESEALYINHLKKCAYTNKMTMEQLKRALELQHKQTSERLALGLPIAPKEKPQRKYQNKASMDSNLELGIALSNSLREYDYMNIIQEKEALVQAGIEPETLSQYRNLEDFGFATNKPAETTNFRGYKKNKNPPSRNTVLFTRTREERERIITEKVANLLIDGDTQASTPTEIISEPFVLKSKYLKKLVNTDTTLWKKSYQKDENIENLYYVAALSNFITPCAVEAGSKLRHVSQIPCRPSSPEKQNIPKKITIPVLSPPRKQSSIKRIIKETKKAPSAPNTDSQLRLDWKYMLNKNVLSDLTIYAKNEVSIFAHKLVFYARCRSILTETIEEIENNKRREMLMWMDYSFEAVIALLEFIYTGALPDICKLDNSNKKDLRDLSNRYAFKEVIDALDRSEEAQMFSNDEDETPTNDREILPVQSFTLYRKSLTPVRTTTAETELFSDDNHSPKNIAVEVTEGERNLQMMLEAMKTQTPRSPELFSDNSDYEDATNEVNKSQSQSIIEDVLSRLCSPVQSPSSPKKQETKPVVSIPLEVDLTQELDCDKKNIEKRKSFSPLVKSQLKKTKILSEKTKRRTPRKLPLSQVLSISDTSEVSDSDESMYKMKKAPSNTSKSDLNNSTSSIDKIDNKDAMSSNSQTTTISGIDEIYPKEFEPSAAGDTTHSLHDQPCQDVNPIWDGFEDFNSMPCDYDYFPDPVSVSENNSVRGFTSPCKSRTTSKRSMASSLVSPGKSKTPMRKSTTDSLFGSFTIEEDFLSKIENQAMAVASQKPLQSSTPDSVKKFQRRSRSENSITPVNKCTWNNVTPMADYSAMKNDDLKKELEKYGIKPGLSRNKAKMMLKYIYEELHPFEDKVNEAPKKTADVTSRKDTEKNSNCSADSYNSSDSETSGVSLLEETYVEDTPDVCTQDSANSKGKVDLHTGFTNLLRGDKLLQRKVLLYEPIWLESLKATLKEYGVRCSMNELMDYLDEKCITFRTQQQRGRQKKKKTVVDKKSRKKKSKDSKEVDL